MVNAVLNKIILKNTHLPHIRVTVYAATLVHHFACLVNLLLHDFEKTCDMEVLNLAFRYGGRYLTIWNFLAQMIHAGLGLKCDLSLIKKDGKDVTKHFKIKEYIYSSIMFPNSVFVFLIFWFLFLQDKTLLMHECIHIRPSVNHGLHTWILLVIFAELIFRPRKRPTSHSTYFLVMIGFMAMYYATVIHAHWESGIWVYPVLHRWKNSLYYIMGSGFVVSVISYWAQWKFVDLLWSK